MSKLYLLDPFAALIENFRMAVLHAPSAANLYGIGPITILCFGLAYDSFKSAEATMADLI